MTRRIHGLSSETYNIPSRWFFFNQGDDMYVVSHGAACGWSFSLVSPLVTDYFDKRARDPEAKDMTLIYLEGKPQRSELSELVTRGERVRTSAGVDDLVEVEFLSKYAPILLQAV